MFEDIDSHGFVSFLGHNVVAQFFCFCSPDTVIYLKLPIVSASIFIHSSDDSTDMSTSTFLDQFLSTELIATAFGIGDSF